MKKVVAISFLLLFLFNTAGYYFVQHYMMKKAAAVSSQTIEQKAYDSGQLIELKVPLNMPYYQNTDFERHEGTITIKGVLYSYVERKIDNGYLILKCLPDWHRQQLKERTDDYFAKVNGLEKNHTGKNDHHKSSVKISFDDFEDCLFQWSFTPASQVNIQYGLFAHYFIPQQFVNTCEQPPEYFC